MEIKYFITDMDGVVFDTMPALMDAFAKAMRPLGTTEEQVFSHLRGSLGAPIEIQIQGIMAKAGKPVSESEIQLVIKKFKSEIAGAPVKIFPGIKETLDELKTRNVSIIASSGSPTAKMNQLFKKFDLPYDFFLGSDKVLKGDKHIEIFAGHFSIPKINFCKRAAFIGDGTFDMEIANRNGIFGIGITNSVSAAPLIEAGAKKIITDFAEVLKFFDN